MENSKQKPEGMLSVRDLEKYVHASGPVHRRWLRELYDTLQAGLKCGMKEGDIIAIKNINNKHADILLLKEQALERYIKVTGMERIQQSQGPSSEYLGVYAAHDIFVTSIARMPKLLKTVYDDLRSGKIKADFLPLDAIIRTQTPKGEKYSIKKDPQVIKNFASLCDIKLRDQGLILVKESSSKTIKFNNASQIVRDAWGDEWTTTYSRMPHGKDDR